MSSNQLDRGQIVDLLYYCGASIVKDRDVGDNVMHTCVVHGESNPSAGVSISKQSFNCFSCHAKGSISWLVLKALPDDFKSLAQVDAFILERYGVDFHKADLDNVKNIVRYGEFEEPEKRFELPKFKLAPFKSGKETYDYFYQRGFTKATAKRFMIGRDLENETVTLPVFWEDNTLAGIIGRYIDPSRPHNSRYKIYEFPKGSLLFPIDKVKVVDNTVILVEGILDAIWLYQLGYTNVLAMMTNALSKKQSDYVKSIAKKAVLLLDNDKMGEEGKELVKKSLKGMILFEVDYPDNKKDPCDLSREEVDFMLENKYTFKGIPRI